MPWTKQDYIQQAYTHLGMADYVFHLQPSELQSALYMLDAMMSEWSARGVNLGWPIPNRPADSDINQDAGITDHANSAIYLNLALRIAPSHGKQVLPASLSQAKQAYDALLIQCIDLPEMSLPRELPLGAGAKPWRDNGDPFVRQKNSGRLPPPDEPVKFWG